jgi:multiple sugar transport system ATP-binding protein
MVREGAHRPGSEKFSFDRMIDVVEPTGPDTMLVFTLGGIEAIGRVDPQDKVSVGTKFRFEVDMSRAKMFDPATGLHL